MTDDEIEELLDLELSELVPENDKRWVLIHHIMREIIKPALVSERERWVPFAFSKPE